MKQLQLALILCLCSIVSMHAQQTFTLSPNPVFGVVMDPTRVEGSATVKNLAATVDTFSWKRTVIRLENDSVCQTQVTDPYLHWFHLVSEKKFILDPGQEGPMNVTLWDFQELGCCAIVHLKLKKLDAPIDSIESYYYLRTCQPLAVKEIQKASIKVFPNPAVNFFSLENAESVARVTICDATGKMLRRMPVNSANQYEIGELSSGFYYLILENSAGSILQVMDWVKA